MSVMVCWVLRFSTLSVTATLMDCPLYLEELHVQVQWNAEWQENHVWHRETLGNVAILHVPCAKGCLDTWITADVFMNCLIGELRGWVKNLTPEMLLLSCPLSLFPVLPWKIRIHARFPDCVLRSAALSSVQSEWRWLHRTGRRAAWRATPAVQREVRRAVEGGLTESEYSAVSPHRLRCLSFFLSFSLKAQICSEVFSSN